MDTAGRVEGFDLMDPAKGLGIGSAFARSPLVLFYTDPPRKEGAVPEPSLEPLVRLAQGGSAGSHPALQAQFSKKP